MWRRCAARGDRRQPERSTLASYSTLEPTRSGWPVSGHRSSASRSKPPHLPSHRWSSFSRSSLPSCCLRFPLPQQPAAVASAGVSGPASARILPERALRYGNRLAATSDRLEDLLPIVDRDESAVIPIELDVNDESVDRQTVQRVIEILGRLDVVANAAGYDT